MLKIILTTFELFKGIDILKMWGEVYFYNRCLYIKYIMLRSMKIVS